MIQIREKKEDIYVLAADGIIEQKIVNETLGLPNAVYMTDAYHLFSSTLPNGFGAEVYSLIENDLKKMCYSELESVLDQSYHHAIKQLRDIGRLNANLERQLKKYYDEKDCYAQHILVKKGTKVFVGLRHQSKIIQVS